MKKKIFLLFFCYIFKYYIYNRRPKNIKDFLLMIPFLKHKIKLKLKENTELLEKELKTNYTALTYLPTNSNSISELENKMKKMVCKEYDKNKISGIVYLGSDDHNNKLLSIFSKFMYSNPLHPDLYPKIRNMEIDIINICKNLYNGNDNCCGNITYGGTESILLACVTYRDYFKNLKNITSPNIVCFKTVHPAFLKAGHYFNIKMILVENLAQMKRTINYNTICIVGSAPEYSYGIIDPIKEMSNLAKKNSIGFHVDACMGGFLLPFIDKYKYINFQLDGITSISMDTHKYGYSFKGSSVLLFSHYKYKYFQHYINKDWCGGIYGTPTIMGSKNGGLIATTWASLLLIGKNKYVDYSNNIRNNLLYIKKNVNDKIEIINEPDLNIIAFKYKDSKIYYLIDKLKKKGWNLTVLQNPPAFHLCLTNLHNRNICKQFVDDINNNIDKIDDNKEIGGTLSLYGSSQKLENSMFIGEIINNYIYLLSQNSISLKYSKNK